MTATPPKIVIRHIEARRSERVAWLLEELGGIPYELDYIRGDVLGSLVELEKHHEMRAPIVHIGDVVMVESAATSSTSSQSSAKARRSASVRTKMTILATWSSSTLPRARPCPQSLRT